MTQEEDKYKKHNKDIKSKPYSKHSYIPIKFCPGYEGYIPENLNQEVCFHCGSIKYYH